MLGRVNHVESSVQLVCVFVYLVLKITEAYLILTVKYMYYSTVNGMNNGKRFRSLVMSCFVQRGAVRK
jgi:hypothetical protein